MGWTRVQSARLWAFQACASQVGLQVPGRRSLSPSFLPPSRTPRGMGGAWGGGGHRIRFQGSTALIVQPSLRAPLVLPAAGRDRGRDLGGLPAHLCPRGWTLSGNLKGPTPTSSCGQGAEALLPSQLCSPDCSSLGTAAPWSDY